MAYIKEKPIALLASPVRIFTDQELMKFHAELQFFKKTDTLTGPLSISKGKEVTYIDFLGYHKHKGTINQEGAVILEVDTFNEPITPSRYERLENKIRQYNLWQGRNEYGKKMQLVELEKLSESMTLPKDYSPYEQE